MGSDFRCHRCIIFWLMLTTYYLYSISSFAANNITRDRSIRDGETVVSEGEKFELGFFSPKGSNLRYVGIWYYRVENQSVVWVANREKPISGNGAVVTIGEDGNLMIMKENGEIVWSSNVTVESRNSIAVLMDTGNLVLNSSVNSTSAIWQSFDHPTDTYLPDMQVYMNVSDREKRVFTSWKSGTDPSPGKYSMGVDPRGSPQVVIWNGPNRHWRSGHWDGLLFIGVPEVRPTFLSGFKLSNEGNGRLYFTYTPSDSAGLLKFLINWEGIEREESWYNDRKEWSLIQQHPVDDCDVYNHCGPFGKCNQMDRKKCSCIEGFVAKDSKEWSRGNWSSGCVRRRDLQCEEGEGLSMEDGTTDGFVEIKNVKLPDFVDFVGSKDVNECKRLCLQNCSCTAYAFVSGLNCMIWNRDLVDVRHFVDGGKSLFVRLDRSELGDKNHVIRTIVITVIIGALLICASFWLLLQCKRKRRVKLGSNEVPKVTPSGEFSGDFSGACDLSAESQQANGPELAMFSFNTVVAATDNFSDENKLGQGGFGHVYKGVLPCSQQIAVKRLSRKSGQGLQEFKNELTLIAKLQHRNLVQLLGCCIEGEEKMLLYEYMPNNSLDSYLFDPDKKAQLEWSKRFSIIEGIARGLLYLHRDSRLRIIHRDLKASNILLDEEMNPKISDFGMARIFGGNQNEANTNIVVGTFGYMAPEYAMEGLFSLKSDVYSFGVLLLEIVTGRRNTSFRSSDYSTMIGYAWDLWNKGRAIELLDPSILNSCSGQQVLRCIHVGMLCVQDIAAQRPNMPSVVLMLEGENVNMPMPSEPTFTSMRHNVNEEMWNVHHDFISSNNVTVSVIVGR